MSTSAPENSPAQPTLPADAPCAELTGGGGQARCDATRPVVLIGSRRDCQLSLPHPDVSKIHCAIINTGREILVRDLLSRSGTFVNEQLVRTAALKTGDTVRVGPASVKVDLQQGSGAPAPNGAASADPLRLATALTLELGGQRIELTHNASVIGRRNAADVLIDTPDVSYAHALIVALADRPAVYDLGSRSGTFLNGQRVELAYLADGNVLEIGGERLVVHWKPPEKAVAAAEAATQADQVAVAQPAPGAAPLSVAGLGAAELVDLERTIGAVHAQISAARTRLDERQSQLDGREAELAQRTEDLQKRAEELQARQEVARQSFAAAEQRERALQTEQAKLAETQAAIEQRRGEVESLAAGLTEQEQRLKSGQTALASDLAALQDARNALEQRQQGLAQALEACTKRDEELKARAAETEAATAQLTQERAALDNDRTALDADRGELEHKLAEQAGLSAALDQKQAEAAQRETQLAAREQALIQREAAVHEVETREAHALERIEKFRSALHRASELFTSASPPPGTPHATEPPGSPAAPRAHAGPTPGDTVGAAPQSPGAPADEDLPAPMVTEPLFGAAGPQPPANWPHELCERFRVLRRLSSKTNAELLAQVWSERGQLPAPPPMPPKKKRRLSWGN